VKIIGRERVEITMRDVLGGARVGNFRFAGAAEPDRTSIVERVAIERVIPQVCGRDCFDGTKLVDWKRA
jgi:hypothetical protein